MFGTRRASVNQSEVKSRDIETRKTHSERLLRDAVLALSIEDLCLDLNIEITKLPRHISFDTLSKVDGRQTSKVDKQIKVLQELLSFSIKVR